MVSVFMSMFGSAGAGLAVTSALAVYAQRRWKGYARGGYAEESAASASAA